MEAEEVNKFYANEKETLSQKLRGKEVSNMLGLETDVMRCFVLIILRQRVFMTLNQLAKLCGA
jgi:hypothetical protein